VFALAPQYTSGQLAGLAGLGIPLPAAVTQAIAAFTAAQALRVPAPPHPGEPARQAARDLAARLARTAAASATPTFDLSDVSAVAAASAEEQRAIDRSEVARELRDAAALLLRETVAAHYAEVTGAIQHQYQATVTEVVKRARRLPPGATDVSALETGGQHRADWIACRDLVAELDRLRQALRLVDGPPPEPVDGLSFCAGYERSGKLADTWMAPAGITEHGPLGSLEFWLDAGRSDSYQFWLPTAAEQTGRIAQLRAERHEQKVRASSVF
jgi:hypothetical protein